MSEPPLFPLPAVCNRCGRNCQPGTADPKARMLRISETSDGYCLDCAVTEWLRITPPICYMLGVHPQAGKWQQQEQKSWDHMTRGEDRRGPEMLLNEQVREQFGAVMRGGFAQASIANINWRWIVENWAIPFPPQRKEADRA